ncbi:hypothetical protein BDV32DRAFT_125331 [Aspergillus pseudonomiae]|uniref:Uncharacterized protein n=1 Tax=Aspergillus pseudonomiae TaxID=1506151 RepID=A0A5N6HZ18_9EURO|nr:uncharacterized protein BDV37DRAFT_281818 [Aspergillus pseudonomiae]KAB8258660.1 hypothetical protein BDV32DRAFT_125331 [Aspergillus pseudonomiae]KAE8405411.1 hypothetical protein BDV37DRAFT_281818 [Aspergillus pseudonomiae]
MNLLKVLAATMALLAGQAVASAEDVTNPSDIEPQVCVAIRVCQGFNFKGPCYHECLKPSTPHQIRAGFKKNAGSFAVDTKGFYCTVGTPNTSTCSGRKHPGFKRLPDYCINNIEAYQCNPDSN